MGILLALYSVIKFFCMLIFKGPLNFSVEILFWIFNGIMFGPFKGTIFSFLCDTVFALIGGTIAYWMIEYAIVPPLTSLFSWFFWKLYKDQNTWTIVVSISTLMILVTCTLTIFFIQLFYNNWSFEGVSSKNIIPSLIYSLIAFLCAFIIGFLTFCLFMFKRKKDWKFIRWLYISTIVITVAIIFRWLWGPYAYIEFARRFLSKDIIFAKQYILTLSGIVMKSCVTIPLAIIIAIPTIFIIDKLNKKNNFNNYF